MLADISAKSLRTRLEHDAQLVERVALLWGIDSMKQDVPATISLLVERMRDPFWTRGVWMLLEEDEQTCLFQAFASGGDRSKGVPLERLRKRTKCSPDVFEGAILRLVTRGLLEEGEVAQKSSTRAIVILQPAFVQAVFVYRESAEALYSTGQELFTPCLDRSSRSLERLVGSRSGEQLKHLAYLCHIPHRQLEQIRMPHELERVVSAALARPLIVFDLLHRLEMEAQELFLWLYQQGGKVPILDVYETFGSEPEHLHALFSQLERYALAFDSLTQTSERVIFIQETVFNAIKDEAGQYTSDERTHAFFPLLSAPSVKQEGQPLICYDLATIVGGVWQGRIEPTKNDALPKRLASKLRPLLQGLPRMGEATTDLYVDMLFSAAQSLEFLRCATPFGEERPRYQPGPKLTQWSSASTEDQVRQFIAWWAKSSSWYDVYGSGKLIPPSGASSARQSLLKQLRRCVPEQWYRLDALLNAIWRQQPLVPYEGSFAPRASGQSTSLHSRREQWMRREGALYAALLSSTLHEAGVISLGYDRVQQAKGDAVPNLFMVTALGAAAFAGSQQMLVSSSPDIVDHKALIVQPNFDMILLELHWGLLYQLLQFAQVVHIGPVCTLKLTQSALLRGLEAGLQVEQALAVLTHHCQHEIPQNVLYTIKEDWIKGFQVASLTEVILIELSSEQSERDLHRVLTANGGEVCKLAPRVFAVTPNGLSFLQIKRILEKANLVVRGQPSLSMRRW